MLVLTRKAGQKIVIGDNVTLCVVAVTGKQVQLGITAPKTVQVHRLEVLEKKEQESTEHENNTKK